MGIKGADLKNESLLQIFAAVCGALHDVEKDDKDASKPVTQHFNLSNHSKEHILLSIFFLNLGVPY